ncbi:sensor histidine kinase [Hypericibacter sp.]|uniref:sensor histidine kinase n=1 Tax=Hypericibacter sp. TaxID=2705401 RepID=UPI003D6D3F48
MNRPRPKLPALWHSLSARLLVLTVAFVMVSEVLIFVPSIASFRLKYLEERLAAANIAVLALLATPDAMVSDELEMELLGQAGAYVIGLKRPDGKKLMLGMENNLPTIDAQFDLRQHGLFRSVRDAVVALVQSRNRVLRVVGVSPRHNETEVEIVIDEAPLHDAMLDYGAQILAVSIVISLITASLVYLALQWWMVRPIRRMTESMIAFRGDPEDLSRPLRVERRGDEIGVAQAELAEMQAGLRASLQHKTRLAALGTAVTKISHDLRNMLATAQLVSDRLVASADPQVKRAAPTLVAAIDRAVDLCTRTLDFTREGPLRLDYNRFALKGLVHEIGAGGFANGRTELVDAVGDVELEADRDQLYRVLANLVRNAAEAGAAEVTVSAATAGERVIIEVRDNGPGLAPRARQNLFTPFAGSGRAGGSGLGLAIARELAHAHGGDLSLVSSDASGTLFRIDLPARRLVA